MCLGWFNSIWNQLPVGSYIIFVLDYVSNMGYYNIFSYVFNYGKLVGSFLDESLE